MRRPARSVGARWEGQVVMPTSGQVGETREVYTSGDECGGHATGTGTVLEVLAT